MRRRVWNERMDDKCFGPEGKHTSRRRRGRGRLDKENNGKTSRVCSTNPTKLEPTKGARPRRSGRLDPTNILSM